MLTKFICVLCMLCCMPVFSICQERLCRVKVFLPKEESRKTELIGLLQLDHFTPNGDGSIDVEITQGELARLKATTYRYQVIIPDVPNWLDSVNKIYYRKANDEKRTGRVAFEQSQTAIDALITRPAAFEVKSTFGGYYKFNEMEAAMNTLVATYPTLATKTSIGTTTEGNNIWVIKISDNAATDEANEPEAFFMGLQHPREAITGASMIFFMQYLCASYATDNRVKELVDSREIFIIPCFNPDGYEYNRTSMNNAPGGSWRKNRNKIDSSRQGQTWNYEYGVDLNRNWGVDWGNCSGSCGSSTPTTATETYWGPNPFSELETQALRAFAKTRQFKVGFDQHAFGPYYSLPFGRQSLHNTPATDMSTKDSNFYKAIPAIMGAYNGMRAADSYDALGYEVAGGFKDWMLMGELGVGTKDTVWAMTGEGAAGGGTPAFGSMANFWAPAGQIVNLCKAMCYQNIQLALAAGSYVSVQEAGNSSLTATTGNLSYTLQRIGLGNSPVTITAIPLENIQTVGSAVTISSMTYYEMLSGNIAYTLPSGITNGQRVRYAWKIETGGITYYDTVVKFFNATQLFFDNMEGALTDNWTNTASGTPASGFGYNYTSGNWQFTTGGYGGSGNVLSESANGTNYTTTTIKTVQCNTLLNLSTASAAYLTFWTRHKAENFRDKVQVQFSTDGTVWTAVRGSITVQEPGILDGSTINGQPALTGIRDAWTKAVYNLDAYRSFANVRFRFVFTSDNDPSTFKWERDEGFFIDDVEVVSSTAAMVVLPANFITFTGKLHNDNTVQLNWVVATSTEPHRFEVERSADGLLFTRIGVVNGQQSAYQFADREPGQGNNYYRIKELDKNGAATYSKTINLQLAYKLTLYPNPVADKLNIQLATSRTEMVSIELSDLHGRLVHTENRMLHQSVNGLTVDTKALKPQVYLLTIRSATGEVIATQKISKL